MESHHYPTSNSEVPEVPLVPFAPKLGDKFSRPRMVTVLEQSSQNRMINTMIRDATTSRADYVFYADRLTQITIEEALNLLPMKSKDVITPTGSIYHGNEPAVKIFCASIVRSGEVMEVGLRKVCRAIRIEKILIQRNEETREPKLIWVKRPRNMIGRWCLLLDPMLATGGSACMAIRLLIQDGILEENIIFICLVAAAEGIARVQREHPRVYIVTASVDSCLNDQGYIIPGLGDFGDRYFGTAD